MRQYNLIRGDMKFQYKYGFYMLYLILIIFYIFALSLLKGNVKETTAIVMIFSDPATMGLFFMGAMVLLEKSEHITNAFAISPVTSKEYIISKVVSIGIISVLAGTLLSFQMERANVVVTILVLFLSSAFFSLCGLIIGANIRSVNQYIIATLPVELFGFVPIILYFTLPKKEWLFLHPCYGMVDLIGGHYDHAVIAVISILLWDLAAYLIAKRQVTKMFARVGGVKL